MDRREALKRLGVGGALAVTAPLLLDSFNVAHAMSGGPVEEEPPDGITALTNPPVTTKANQVKVEFNPDAFDREGTLWFYWTVLSAIPAITLEVDPVDSHIAQVKKATGQGNLNTFTIEVQVHEEPLDGPMEHVATYLVVSEGGLLSVTLQPD
jgi:hypothetical protein